MTTSTNLEAGTGLKKCRPMTSLLTLPASSETDSEEVLVAMTASGAAAETLANACVLSSMDSGTASTTSGNPAKSAASVDSVRR